MFETAIASDMGREKIQTEAFLRDLQVPHLACSPPTRAALCREPWRRLGAYCVDPETGEILPIAESAQSSITLLTSSTIGVQRRSRITAASAASPLAAPGRYRSGRRHCECCHRVHCGYVAIGTIRTFGTTTDLLIANDKPELLPVFQPEEWDSPHATLPGCQDWYVIPAAQMTDSRDG